MPTAERLMNVAERLFATNGINSTRVADIVKGAGQRNPSALSYHFGSAHGVLMAIIGRHQQNLEDRRARLLDDWPEPGPRTGADGVRLTIQPLMDLLEDESGRHYLCIVGQLIDQLDLHGTTNVTTDLPTLIVALDLMRRAVPDADSALTNERVHSVLLMSTATLATRAKALIAGTPPTLSNARMRQNLLAMCTSALMTAVPSADDGE